MKGSKRSVEVREETFHGAWKNVIQVWLNFRNDSMERTKLKVPREIHRYG